MTKAILYFFVCAILTACSVHPGSLRKLPQEQVEIHPSDFSVSLDKNHGQKLDITYLGCGGVYLLKGGRGLLIDPFFSNQPAFRIGKSVLLGRNGRKNIKVQSKFLNTGLAAIGRTNAGDKVAVDAIINAHSHYDHLMDVPAVYQQYETKPAVLLSETGYNICHNVIDSVNVTMLEKHSSSNNSLKDPITITNKNGAIHIYPILSAHNPHYKNIKFFSGSQLYPSDELRDPMQKSRANLWLEGNTFSFVIDYVNDQGRIDLRIFVQSSACNAPAGIPPAQLLGMKRVDVAFIGLASYEFSPGYPCELLEAISPRQIVWIHWEDFFRKYTKDPKTLRGTDIPGFFSLPCVAPYKNSGKLLWPRVKMELVY